MHYCPVVEQQKITFMSNINKMFLSYWIRLMMSEAKKQSEANIELINRLLQI